MTSLPGNLEFYPSTTPKRVHFDVTNEQKSPGSSKSSRLPQSPYPEALKLEQSTPPEKESTEDSPKTESPELSLADQIRRNIRLSSSVYPPRQALGQHPVPLSPTRFPSRPLPSANSFIELYNQGRSFSKIREDQESSFAASSPDPYFIACRRDIAATMAQQYENAVPSNDGAVNFQPPVPDTTHGPETHYYVPRHDVPPGLDPGFGFGVVPQAMPLQTQAVQWQYQTLQPAAMPFMGQPPLGIPLQQVVPPQQVMQQPIAQPTMQPMMLPAFGIQPALPQPTHPMYMQQALPVSGDGTVATAMSFAAGGLPDPAFGVGLTGTEVAALNNEYAARSNVDEPQDFQPADPDPSRMYRVRELDGTWVLFNRFTIDRGAFRWYLTDDGVFYAVRLPS